MAAVACGLYLAILAAGCAPEPGPAARQPEVEAVVVEPAQLSLQAGGEAWLGAQANDASGQPIGRAQFRFRAEDPRLLQVSDRGQVIALGPVTPQTGVVVASGGREKRVPVTVLPGAPARVEGVSGEMQRATAGEPAAAPLVARLVDGFGNPLENEPVVVESSAGFFDPLDVVSGAGGLIELRLPPIRRAGEALVSVRSRDVAAAAGTFHVEVVPAAPAAIDLVPPADDAPAAALARLRVSDAFGNPVPGVQLVARVVGEEREPRQLTTDAAGLASLDVAAHATGDAGQVEVALPDGSLRQRFDIAAQPAPRPAAAGGG